MASNPTYKPSVYVGRVDPKKLEPLTVDRVAKQRNYPGINRAIAGVYPPGSTFKPLTALAAISDGLLSPYEYIQCTPYAEYGLDKHRFENWNPYTNKAMTLTTALAQSCDTYFYDVGNRYYTRGEHQRGYWTRMQSWARKFGFGETAGARHRRRGRPGCCRRRPGGRRNYTAGRPRLEPGRPDPARDRPEGHHRHAAADGPLLRGDRERRQARDAVPRLRGRAAGERRLAAGRAADLPAAAAAARRRRPERARGRPRGPLPGDARRATAPRRASSAASRSRSPARPARPRRSSSCPAIRPGISRTRPGGAAGGRTTATSTGRAAAEAGAARRLRRDRERRPRRRRRGAGGARRSSSSGSRSAPASRGWWRGRDDRVRLLPRRSRVERLDVLGFLRRLDWVLLAAVAALVAYGLWAVAGITRHDVEGDENYYVVRQAIAAGLGFVGFLVALAIDPDRYRRAQAWLYGSPSSLMLLVYPLAETTRGSKRWIDLGPFQFQPSEFGKLLFVLALARLPRRPGAPAQRAARSCCRRSGSRSCRSCSSSSSPTSAPRSSTRAALAACLFVAGVRWAHLAALGVGRRASIVASVVWFLPAAGVEVLEPYQIERLTGFAEPRPDLAGVELQRQPVDHRGRLRRPQRPRRRRARRRRGSTTCPSTRPTSSSPRSPSSAASSARRSCSASTCSSSGAGCG